MTLVRYSQLLAALGAARSQYATAILGCHALAETMLVHAAAIVWLECSFHCYFTYFVVIISRFGLQNYANLFNYASFSQKKCSF
jgi:hypothetical protein